ncbi:Olfactory receptor 4C15 [Sciurus carolinensis]|uniref:Olfactory receptor 4C15 n=1 Tax=Sciurus carolinensis TaxID=30640 RepID=A0AA41SUV3_SCICA|nr:Olfactory receptor 4C15 [Sciurus carolinensis]
MENQSNITEFPLGAFQSSKILDDGICWFLFVYLATFGDKKLISVTILCSPALLGSPMHFSLALLSFLDGFFSAITPKMITASPYEKNTISYKGFMVQLFAEHVFGEAEVIVLLGMAYDHYVVICKSLHYFSIMN